MKAVILAGGAGTRLWPLSTDEKPKQFQSFVSAKTLFQETIERLDFLQPKDIFVATNEKYLSYVHEQAPKIPKKNILLEPALRDTAACIGYAAVYLQKKFPNEVMSIIYSDHLIQKEKEFIQKLKIAEKLAKKENTLNIIEVKAKEPNVNLGYVKIGKMLGEINGIEIFALEKFIEKPDLKTAQKFVNSYHYLWNTGYYVWEIKIILEQYKKHAPEIFKYLIKIQQAIGTQDEKKVLYAEYPKCPKISIDYAVMEKVDKKSVRIIPADLGWSDIGTWESLHKELVAKEEDNLIKGKSQNIDSNGCLIYNYTDQPVATIGLKDICVIQTRKGLLICAKGKSGEVRKVVSRKS